jgi:hypothetical protein
MTACSYETTVEIYQTTRRHTPQDSNLHTYHGEILKADYEEKYLSSQSTPLTSTPILFCILQHIHLGLVLLQFSQHAEPCTLRYTKWSQYSTKTSEWRDGNPQKAPPSLFQSRRLEPANLTTRAVNIRYRDQAAGTMQTGTWLFLPGLFQWLPELVDTSTTTRSA